MKRFDIEKYISYFVKKYSLVELFSGIWMNYALLKSESVNKQQEKSFQYYICCYQEACYRKWDSRFLNFLFLKECFRKQLKLHCPPGLFCSKTELADYIDFLCNVKNIIYCLMKKI